MEQLKTEITLSWSEFKKLHSEGRIEKHVSYNVYPDGSNKLNKR